jgi:ketosteroid isomerase-like protein
MSTAFETAQDTEDSFYDAFEEADLEKMMSAWDDTQDIACIQPMREAVQGQAAVRESWAELFRSGTDVEIEIHHQHWIETGETAIHIVHEQLILNADRQRKPPPLIATNVYRKGPDGWRMVLHHASPPPPPRMPPVPGMGPGMGPPPHV